MTFEVYQKKFLTILPFFFKDNWESIDKIPMQLRCLIAQVLFSVAPQVNLSVAKIIKNLKVSINETVWNLHTLNVIFDSFLDIGIDLTIKTYSNSHLMIKALKQGIPIIVPIDNRTKLFDEMEYYSINGITKRIKTKAKLPTPSRLREYHALLLVGYDEQTNHLIFRDIRKSNLYKGYIKVNKDDFQKYGYLTAFSVHV